MKKIVLGIASLTLATSILGACGKDDTSSKTSAETTQETSALSVSDVTINGKKLSNADVQQYKDEYMKNLIKGKSKSTEATIKNIALKDALMKDLGVTQEQIDKEYNTALEVVKKGPKGVTAPSKGMVLHQTLAKAYAEQKLSDDSTVQKVYDTLKDEEKKGFSKEMLASDYYRLYFIAKNNKVVDVVKYQQDLLKKSNVKGLDVNNLQGNETIL